MDFSHNKSKDNILNAPNESLDTQIENLINSNNFDTRINIAFNHLNEIINLTSADDEIINLSTSLPANDSSPPSGTVSLDDDFDETSGTANAGIFSNIKTNPTDDTLFIPTTHITNNHTAITTNTM